MEKKFWVVKVAAKFALHILLFFKKKNNNNNLIYLLEEVLSSELLLSLLKDQGQGVKLNLIHHYMTHKAHKNWPFVSVASLAIIIDVKDATKNPIFKVNICSGSAIAS